MPKGIYDRSKSEPRPRMSEETKRKIGKANSHKLSEEHKQKLRKPHKKGYKLSEETKKKMSEARKGKGSSNWKGGISSINERLRKGIEFRLWREAVFARDNWTCQDCKVKSGKLHPHHIKEFAKYPELRFAIDNGVTLCIDCHKKTNNYGNPVKKEE